MDEEQPAEMDIHTACSLGDEEFVKEIINRTSSDVNIRNTNSWTPMMYACWGGHVGVAAVLLQAGADRELVNLSAQTALMLAVHSGSLALVELVFKESILNLVDCHGKSAVHYAVEFNYLTIVKYLLKKGANLYINGCGKTPLSTAMSSGHRLVAADLIANGAQQVMTTACQGATDLKSFLRGLSLEKYWPLFQSNCVDLQMFLKMDETDLKSIGINLLGPRRKLFLAIKAFTAHRA